SACRSATSGSTATSTRASSTPRESASRSESVRQLEAEQPGGVQPQHLGALAVAEPRHGALDRRGGVRPRAFVVRVVVRPQEAVFQTEALHQLEPRRVLAERREAVAAEIL